MGTIVNLRTIRKRAARETVAKRAAANRVLHGTGKAERLLGTARKAKTDYVLEQHRIEHGDGQ